MNMLSMLILQAQEILHREDGQDLIEYALLVALISLAAFAATSTLGSEVSTFFAHVDTVLQSL